VEKGALWVGPGSTIVETPDPERRSTMAAATDPLETRKKALTTFLDAKVRQGARVESKMDTHAIIIVGGRGERLARIPLLNRFFKTDAGSRQVVEVDEHGKVTTRPAEPKRH
jgi:hypothetical protein